MIVKLIIANIISACWIIGGQRSGRLRDIFCPILLGMGLLITLPGDWLHRIIAGIATIAFAQVIRIGYGNYSPEDDDKPSFLASILKDRQGAIIRMVWGLLVGIITPLALVFIHYLTILFYIAYILTNAAINYSVSRFQFSVFLADVCVAGAFGSLLFLVK